MLRFCPWGKTIITNMLKTFATTQSQKHTAILSSDKEEVPPLKLKQQAKRDLADYTKIKIFYPNVKY